MSVHLFYMKTKSFYSLMMRNRLNHVYVSISREERVVSVFICCFKTQKKVQIETFHDKLNSVHKLVNCPFSDNVV